MVEAANRPEAAGPKRASLPSMLPPDWVAVTVWSAPSAVSLGLPPVSNAMATSGAASHRANMAASTT